MTIETAAAQTGLREEVVLLEKQTTGYTSSQSSLAGLSVLIPDVKRITEELFPGPFSCGEEFDPEHPDDTYLVIDVQSTGEMEEILRRQNLWHERVRSLGPGLFGRFRISIAPH